MGQDKPEGSVMIIGGGIAGMQAALTLSDAGYGVYLIERTASLGGMIPDLHRIYPLCACCKLNPRIAACEQDPNIDVMLDTSVESVSGSLGEFTVSIKTETGANELKVGAIILAGGIETFDPSGFETYSYGLLPNVITSVEYEQIQKPLGPEQGIIKRPSDGKTPEKIAWLQCVGSRDINRCDAPYCSSVCCMYALKEAVNTKEYDENIETTIFYMDIRTHGKGFEEYLNNAITRDVRLIRSRVHTLNAIPGSDDIEITFVDDRGESFKEIFDMVVLSVGLKPSKDAIALAKKIGVNIDTAQFVRKEPFRPVSTNLPGIFVCGGLAGPNDIGQSIVQAGAAVSEIASCIAPKLFEGPKEYPEPRDINNEEPEVLVAYHLCQGMAPELGTELEKSAGQIPGVNSVIKVEDDIVATLTDGLKKSSSNRLVFASCTPVIHKSLIEEALRLAGLNPYLYETVDLRMIEPETVSVQIRDRIRMGVTRAALISAPPLKEIPVVKRALVVGGGVSGLECSLALAKEGYPVTLVEKKEELGGHGRHVTSTWQGNNDVTGYLKDLISSVKEDKNITVITGANITANRGMAGNFTTVLEKNDRAEEISHGVTVLAPGGEPFCPSEYLYGQHKNVYIWSELSKKMMEGSPEINNAQTAVFIQCVGSRETERPYCSNLCCTFSVKTAIDLKSKNPDMDIYILYREIRTFGERENLYREAREKGVIFIRYDLEEKPVLKSSGDDKITVLVKDHVLGRPVSIMADFVSLQTAIMGNANQELAKIFGVNLDKNGFFAESPEKMRPVNSTRRGVYITGLAAYPKDLSDSICQAKAVAARALEILKKETLQVGGLVAEVRPEKCAVCCTCVRTCPFEVPYIDHENGAAYIDPALCRGCGMCVAECPGKAIEMSACSDQMLTLAPSVLLGVK